MKIKMSKGQWEQIGRESGWTKKAQVAQPVGPGGPFARPIQQQPAKPQAAPQQAPQQAKPQAATPTLTWLQGSLEKVLNSGAIAKELQAIAAGGGSAQTMSNALIGQLQQVIAQLQQSGQ